MPGTPVRLGPFTGGINVHSDASSIADNELVDCVNFDLDLDGSLVSRSPAADITYSTNFSVMGGRVICLGYGTFVGDRYYLFACGPAGVGVFYNGTWTLIAPNVKSKSIAQFDNKVWICATNSSPVNGGWYSPDATPVYTTVPTQPRGGTIVAHKFRLWIGAGSDASAANGHRVYYSKVDATGWHPDQWDSPGGLININPGDGQEVINLQIWNDNIIIFKTDSTYIFAFTDDPGLGQIVVISKTVGATQEFCVTQYENVIYTFHEGWVYEISNYIFTRINDKVPFVYEPVSEPCTDQEVYLYLLGDRLVVRYFRRVYVFGLRVRVWTRYASSRMVGYSIGAPTLDFKRHNAVYYAGSAADSKAAFYRIQEGLDNQYLEEMTCSIVTKNYDMGVSSHFKKLYWWGADLQTVDSVKAIVTIVVLHWVTTWGMLMGHTWDSLSTWGNPINQQDYTTTTVPVFYLPLGDPQIPRPLWSDLHGHTWAGLYTWRNPLNANFYGGLINRPQRVFVKLLKGLRFRQVKFQIVMTTDGSLVRGPVKIYSLTAFTNAKEVISKQVA